MKKVLVFQCQPTALLRASGSTQGGQMALGVVYFRITHRLGRPHYVRDENLYSVLQEVEVRVTACITVCVVYCNCVMMKGKEVKPGAGSQSTLLERTKGAARLNVPILRTNRYQQYYMPSQYTYCGRVWNLIQDCDVQSSDYKVCMSTAPSPEVENFQI